MISPRTRLRFLAGSLLALLLGAVLSCNVASENGKAYLSIKKDSAWAKFDSLEIAWKDSVSGKGGVLFQGNPNALADANKLPADGYDGRKIVITVKGFNARQLAYEEERTFDGANPGASTKKVLLSPNTPITPGTPKTRPPKLTAIKADTLVSIGDSVAFAADASLDSGSLKGYAWDYDGDGKFDDSGTATGKSARLTGGFRYPSKGTFKVTLRAVSDSDSATVAGIVIVVLQDEPSADAGKDVSVYPNATVSLHGTGKDGLGVIVKTEWKIGSGPFVAAPGDTSFTAPAAVQDIRAFFRVTDDDNQTATDSLVIHVISPTESNLTDLVPSAGQLSPPFNPAVIAYADTVPYEVSSLTVTPTGNGVLKVNGTALASGQKSASIDLKTGTSVVVVTVQVSGSESKAYSIAVIRREASNDAGLKSLSLSAGALDKPFSPGDTLYTVNAPDSVSATTVTASASQAGATLAVNGKSVLSGTVSEGIGLGFGENAVTVVVTAPGGATKTYHVRVLRAMNGNAALSALRVSAGALVPAFSDSVKDYSLSVADSVASIQVTATTANVASTLVINGRPAVSGTAVPVSLSVGANSIVVEVTAQSGSKSTYALHVTRAGNGNADLASLSLSAGAISGAFRADSVFYTLAVANSVTSTTVTAKAAKATSTVTINKQDATAGTPVSVNLDVGNNTIAVVVTAQSGDKKTYTVVVTRAPNGNTGLASLTATAGIPALVTGTDSAYTLSVANDVVSTTITPTVSASTSTLTVNGVASPSGSISPSIPLNVGANAIKIEVTAQSGAKKTYVLTVTRAANADATLAGLSISAGPFTPSFMPDSLDYSITVSYPMASATVTPTINASTSTVKVNGAAVASGSASAAVPLSVGKNSILIQVTAQSGATRTYTLHCARNAKVISIAAGGNHALALRADGTVFAWGDNARGQCNVPPGLTGITAISASGRYSMALKGDGTVVAWGLNDSGQTAIPAGLTGVKAISAGDGHALALKGTGTVAAWGSSAQGEITVPAGLSGVTAISAGYMFSMALKGDKTITEWGYDGQGQTLIPSSATGVTAIAAGNFHAVALKGDGTVVAWGDNSDGECNVPVGLTGATAISAGANFTLALKSDGTVAAWGRNISGQINVPAGLTGVTAIAAGYNNSIALKGDGTVVIWGESGFGELLLPPGSY